ncbi:unnamed protein product [Rotaria sp. Silwood1]|nr:unnamed protein product [Rotaria sp. Silwood1]CAF3556845.1 unnamed protein product [Rotaria sp. Silwood1]CAF4557411.1 unnamed protein product [Rotaria sp. Silwood1]CAF5112380.1 unnamed protein product [Rotaria sp. Silwood1]
MASMEYSGQSSVYPFAASGSAPSTTINMTSNSTSSVPYLRSSKKGKGETSQVNQRRRFSNKPSSVTDAFMVKMSYRLSLRKKIHKQLSILSDIMCFLGILGIVLMIIETELTFKQFNDKDTVAAWSIRVTITITTVILIAVILLYHRAKLCLYCVDHSFDNWRVGLTNKKIFLIALEIAICAIHPVPRPFPHREEEIAQTSGSTSTEIVPYLDAHIDIDVGLVFARLYLICRPLLYHSRLVHDAGSGSIGYLNTVSINFLFVIRAYLKQWPIRCLLIWATIVYLSASWALRACEYQSNHEHSPFTEGLWLAATVFTTIGYNTVAPLSHCGRTICALANLCGLLTVALFLGVVTQELALNRWENYLHTFVLNTELVKEHRHQAANVIKFAFKIWLGKKKHTPLSAMRNFQTKRKLFGAIRIIQNIRNRQQHLTCNLIGLPEIMTTEQSTNVNTDETIQKIKKLESKMNKIEKHLANVTYALNGSQNDFYFSL